MLAWKNICGILPKGLPSRLIAVRQSSAFPVVFSKRDLAKYGLRRGDPEFRLLTCASGRPGLRFFSAKSSQEKKEKSVFQELVEAQEQPQTQLTVGAKGLPKLLINCYSTQQQV